jgi:prophage regulatory protein
VNTEQIDPRALLRLPQVLALVAVSRSTFWKGVAEGRFPRPVRLPGTRAARWRAGEIFELIQKCEKG